MLNSGSGSHILVLTLVSRAFCAPIAPVSPPQQSLNAAGQVGNSLSSMSGLLGNGLNHALAPILSTSSPEKIRLITGATSDKVWYLPSNFTMDALNITEMAWGEDNLQLLTSIPDADDRMSGSGNASSNHDSVMQVRYPEGSINPQNRTAPSGGIGFYASPLDLSKASNVSLYYSVFFPIDFDFGKGGKLPGLYGGTTRCSGGENSDKCFSTRLMFRTNGTGELYLYAPKSHQVPSLCQTPPYSDCNTDYGYSIGRGAWSFLRGGWTDVRQDIWLNNDGANDGGFNIWINGQLVLHSDQVYYRHPGTQRGPVNQQVQADRSASNNDQRIASTGSQHLQTRPEGSSFVAPTSLGLPHPIGSNFSSDFRTSSQSGLISATTTPLTSLNPESVPVPEHSPIVRRLVRRQNQMLGGTSTNLPSSSLSPPSPAGEKLATTVDQPIQLSVGALGANVSGIARETMPEYPERRRAPVEFGGIMADTFFGGHDPSWASSKNQYSYFNRFGLRITQ